MGYTKTEFGKLDNGDKVYRYTLTNSQGVSASFTDLGGRAGGTECQPDRRRRIYLKRREI